LPPEATLAVDPKRRESKFCRASSPKEKEKKKKKDTSGRGEQQSLNEGLLSLQIRENRLTGKKRGGFRREMTPGRERVVGEGTNATKGREALKNDAPNTTSGSSRESKRCKETLGLRKGRGDASQSLGVTRKRKLKVCPRKPILSDAFCFGRKRRRAAEQTAPCEVGETSDCAKGKGRWGTVQWGKN